MFGVLTGLLVIVERVRHGSVVHVRARSGAVVEAGESKDLMQVETESVSNVPVVILTFSAAHFDRYQQSQPG